MKINRCKSLFCSFKQVLKNIKNKHAFTLLEVIVAIIIIGALLAFALPKYETALDKSRFSTLMPITKSIKDAEEIFYVASNQYTPDIQSLDVKTNPGETVQISVVDDDDYSYVQAIDPRIDNIYKAYLKHSTNFPEERHCEALSDSSRAKKVCENLGGTEVGENGNYIAYSLDANGGHGTFEKDCEDAQPDTEQTCASGCGTQTRTVTCNRRTGTWETGDFEGDCPVQGDTTQTCTNGVGTETRTFSCEGNTWVANEWDTSSCTCDPEEKPDEEQACTHGGTMTRIVTCNPDTLEWEADETWDKSNCKCDTDAQPSTSQTCASGCGTKTRTNSCVNGVWIAGTWQGTCEDKPATSAACTSGSGTMTRTVTCNGSAWSTGAWNTSSCQQCDSSYKLTNQTFSCASGGTVSISYTCQGTTWVPKRTSNGCTMSGMDWYNTYNQTGGTGGFRNNDANVGVGILDTGSMYMYNMTTSISGDNGGTQLAWFRYTSNGSPYQFTAYNANTGLYEAITFNSTTNPTGYTITTYKGVGAQSWNTLVDEVGIIGSGSVSRDASGNWVLSNGTVIPALNSSNFNMSHPNSYGN